MDLIEREKLPDSALRTERVPLESIGGEVIVRGRMLAQTLEMLSIHASASPRDGETEDEAKVRAGAEVVAQNLAHQVVLGDGKPMWSAAQWQVHGGKYPAEVMRLHEVAQRVSGAEDVEKN